MVKYLYLCRHAKSDWSDANADDIERNLNPRGYRDAGLMGDVLKRLAVRPKLIVSSPAVRARDTAMIYARKLDYNTDNIQYEEAIYEASTRALLYVINNLDPEPDEVMLFGHNPGFTYLAEYLTKEGFGNMPTSGVVKITFKDLEWPEVSEGTGTLSWFEYPKKHR